MNEPPGSENYPDDGSVIFDELDFSAGLAFRLPFRTDDRVVRPVLLYENLGNWTEGGEVPSFADAWEVRPMAAEISLAQANSSARNVGGEEIQDPKQYSQARCVVAYPVPPVAGDQWQYLRLRARLKSQTFEEDIHGVVSQVGADAFSGAVEWLANPPVAGESYDAEDPLTWPRFDIVAPSPPAAPSAPGVPVEGNASAAFTLVNLEFTWPRPDEFWFAGAGHYAPGAIPGTGDGWLRRWRSVELTLGRLPL